MRKTKIICTIGPASQDEKILERLISSGMDLARINTSHSDKEEVEILVNRIRKAAKKSKRDVAIILDLQGPKIRVGQLEEELELKNGQKIILSTDPGRKGRKTDNLVIPVTYNRFIDDIKADTTIFIDDGLIECRVLRVRRKDKDAECKVITSGILSSHKGINLPGVSVSVNSVTRRDIEYLKLGLELEVDFIAQSFVRTKEDVEKVRKVIDAAGSTARIISKIEKHEAVDTFEKILEVSDAIMVARGDLGIEIEAEEVPAIQKRIIRRANLSGKPVITATQMLNSMIENPRPTRAEVSDVANAILDGSDAVMLSGETAIGKYAVKSLQMMVRIIKETEKTLDYELIAQNNALLRKKLNIPYNTITEAISFAACEVATILGADAIISSTESGNTARQVSKNRPKSLIIGTSPNKYVVRQLMLSWGVIPFKTVSSKNIDGMIEEDIKVSLKAGLIKKGDRVVITAGVMANKPGSTNLINVRNIE
jgi:pyruvate kinase